MTVIYYPMHMHLYAAFPRLNGMLSSNVFIVFVATYASVFLQLFFPFLLLTRPTRILALVGIMGMHVGIGIMLALPFFSLAMIGADLIFVRDRIFARVASRLRPLPWDITAEKDRGKMAHRGRGFAKGEADVPAARGSVLIYDGDCGFCQRTLDAMKSRLATWPRTAPYQGLNLDQHGVRGQDAARAILWVEPGMPPLAGAAAFARLFREQSQRRWRALGAMMALPGISHIATIVYRTVARHRHRLLSGTSSCDRPSAKARDAEPESSPVPRLTGQQPPWLHFGPPLAERASQARHNDCQLQDRLHQQSLRADAQRSEIASASVPGNARDAPQRDQYGGKDEPTC